MMHVTVLIEHPMIYLPGQFAILELPGLGRRAYSMANRVDGGKCLAFIVKVKPNGSVSRDLAARRSPGDRLSIEGPYGRAYFRADGERPIIAIAGGSGLAPMWSIAQAASTQGKRDIHLYFGVNSARDICFTEEFANLSSICGRVRTHFVVRDGERAPFRAGLVGDAVVDDFPDLRQFDVYMAGPPAMIDAVLKRFVGESRVDTERVFFDRFI
jgi:toluene monooxygenase electron transfer component